MGLAGVLAAAPVGRLADKRDARLTVGLGIACTLASFGVFWLVGKTLWGLVAGVLLMDLGVQTAHISNQTRVFALRADARSRFNTIYMVVYFTGGGVGLNMGPFDTGNTARPAAGFTSSTNEM